MKLAIFDLDGTLLDTIADLAAATNFALAHYGLPTHKEEEYKFFVGNGINKMFERALPEDKRNEEYITKLRSQFIPYYDVHNSDLSRPYPGMVELLKELQRNNIAIGVASNKYQEAAVKLVLQFFPGVDFALILGQREGIPSKPDPTIAYEIIEHTGIAKEDTVYIGDSCVDMQTGKNAGITTVGVSWGFRPKAELESYNPDFIADNADELRKYLLGD